MTIHLVTNTDTECLTSKEHIYHGYTRQKDDSHAEQEGGGKASDFIMLLGMAYNSKLMNRLFLDFSI